MIRYKSKSIERFKEFRDEVEKHLGKGINPLDQIQVVNT